MIIDSHHHFWDPAKLKLPAPPPEAALLAHAYLPAHLRPQLQAVGVNSTVLVQAYPQTHQCNRWLFDQANSSDFVLGVVAWADLLDPTALPDALDALIKEPKFVGLRHIVEDEPDLNWILQPPVLQSLKILADRGIPFDMLVKPPHLKNVLKILDKLPNLRMVIDHIAKPNIANGGSDGWDENITAIARNKNVYCKLSGMITEADWKNWKPSDLTPYVQHVISVFGWDRVMFGSDWPVCLLAGQYQQVFDALNEAFGKITQAQRDMVFADNAIRFYGLKTSRG